MTSKNYPRSRKDSLVVQEANEEVLIYDLSDNRVLCLNKVSALIWQFCDGNKSVEKISHELSKELNTPANEDLVWFAIDQLKKENLIENRETLDSKFEGLSRREIIKRVGLGSVIALPIVASVVAPLTVYAQSCIAMGDSCTAGAMEVCCGSMGGALMDCMGSGMC